jgi:hypothetical protein
MTPQLKEIIEKAYKVFSKYKVSKPLDICTFCCATEIEESNLIQLNVKEIPAELLMIYNDSAQTEKTEIEEIKHFLPRYLDLIAQYDFPSHSTELALKRLGPYSKDEWNPEEYELIELFTETFFNQCLSVYPFPINESLDSILIMMWKAKIDVSRLLILWENKIEIESLLHFKDLVMDHLQYRNYIPRKLSNPFADDELSALICDWITNQNTKQLFISKIEKVILESYELSDMDASQLSWTYELLDKL